MTKYKDIPGYEGFYQAGYNGTIRSVTKRVRQCSGRKPQLKIGKILSPAKDRIGYMNCALSKENILRSFKVHRLVALTWVPNPNGYTEVNHIDGNKENNSASNLEWCTRSQNIRHAYSSGLITGLTRDNHGKSVVMSNDIPNIISYRKSGIKVSTIAGWYGCSVDVIYRLTKQS